MYFKTRKGWQLDTLSLKIHTLPNSQSSATMPTKVYMQEQKTNQSLASNVATTTESTTQRRTPALQTN
jgi:hypothetical protein